VLSKHLESVREEHRQHSLQMFEAHAKEIEMLEARNRKLMENLDKRED
jgi:hypothetical protein